MDKSEGCQGCGLYEYKHVPWQYVEHPQLPVLLVGEAPGDTEALTRVPFTGSSGKVLYRLLKHSGVDKFKLSITNVVQCVPPKDKGSHRDPTSQEVEMCIGFLKDKIHVTKPKLIVAIGKIAMRELAGKSKATSVRGQLFPLLSKFEYECEVLCLLHPAFVMRQRQWIDIATKDAAMVRDYFDPTIEVKEKIQPTFSYNPPPHKLAEALQKMSKDITAVDIETPGELDILSASVIGIAFCADNQFAVAVDFPNGMNGYSWDVVDKFLEDKQARKCTQNGSFDKGVLETNGIKMNNLVYDTLLAEHTMNSDLPGNLDFLRGRYTDVPQYKPDKQAMGRIAHWTAEERLEMNCWDVVATLEVMKAQKAIMDKKQLRVLEEIEMPLIDVCNSMERRGIKIDVSTLALLYKDMYPKADEIEKTYFAPLGLNPRSPKQLSKYFGLASTDKKIITAQIKRNHPHAELMQHLLDYKKMQKIISTYIEGVYNRLRNDRIHAHPKIDGTGTGRLSYRNPNLQNVIKPLRIVYIPDDEDHCILEGDYSQLEVRVGANVAQEKTMLAQLAEGLYVHKVMGLEVYGRDWEELSDQEKLRTKTVVFGTFYGRSARSIAMEFNVSTRTAEEWQNICIKKYPGMLRYLNEQRRVFENLGYCVTPFGRKRMLQTVTQAYNTPIQSSASDVCLTTLIELYKRGFDLMVTVHDSIVVQAPIREMKDVSHEMRRIMERPIEQLYNYQFPAKLEAGSNWYEIKEVVR